MEVQVVNAIDDLPLWRAARRNDPPTSKAAGANSRRFAGGHCRRILEALAIGPGTKDEIAARCGLDEQQVARRMHELRRAGLVVELGVAVSPSGNREMKYRRSI
jgi:predicted Rossmann fold nucleotide-binding protein DprA/Smf involved in DNA uptake